jgi:sister-chromatid-cohesion protein PDS5
MCSILQACIEECDDIDQDLLDILLTPLLPSSKAENPMSYKCVGNVLRSTSACIQASVSAFINHVLVGTAIPGKAKTSELADHIYPLIFELHKIQPQLLLRVLPNICVQLQAEEEDIRLKAVKLLGQLFSSNHADYATEFSKNFRDFLGRFNDLSSVVRLEMVDSGSLIMKRKVQHRTAIEGDSNYSW